MNRFRPRRFQTPQSVPRTSATHCIAISNAASIGPSQLAAEFASMIRAPGRNTGRVIIQVDSGELIYLMPKTGEVVLYGEAERN
jgi:hypothetical protein